MSDDEEISSEDWFYAPEVEAHLGKFSYMENGPVYIIVSGEGGGELIQGVREWVRKSSSQTTVGKRSLGGGDNISK